MPLAAFVPIIAQYGLPVVLQIVTMIEAGGNVTSAQIQQLIAAAQINAQAEMTAVLKQHNIDPASAAGAALLALAA